MQIGWASYAYWTTNNAKKCCIPLKYIGTSQLKLSFNGDWPVPVAVWLQSVENRMTGGTSASAGDGDGGGGAE